MHPTYSKLWDQHLVALVQLAGQRDFCLEQCRQLDRLAMNAQGDQKIHLYDAERHRERAEHHRRRHDEKRSHWDPASTTSSSSVAASQGGHHHHARHQIESNRQSNLQIELDQIAAEYEVAKQAMEASEGNALFISRREQRIRERHRLFKEHAGRLQECIRSAQAVRAQLTRSELYEVREQTNHNRTVAQIQANTAMWADQTTLLLAQAKRANDQACAVIRRALHVQAQAQRTQVQIALPRHQARRRRGR